MDWRRWESSTTKLPTISATIRSLLHRSDVVSDGEWRTPRIIYAQFQNVSGNDIGQFKDMSRQIVVWPPGPAISSIPMAKRAGEPTGLKRGRENESSLG
jgi:hypothetical protein